MKAKAPVMTSRYAVGCDEKDAPYSRFQVAMLRLLGMVLGRHIV